MVLRRSPIASWRRGGAGDKESVPRICYLSLFTASAASRICRSSVSKTDENFGFAVCMRLTLCS